MLKDRRVVYHTRYNPANCPSPQDNCSWFLKISCFQLWTEPYPKGTASTEFFSPNSYYSAWLHSIFFCWQEREPKDSPPREAHVTGTRGKYSLHKHLKTTGLGSLCPRSQLPLQNIIINIFQQIHRQEEENGAAWSLPPWPQSSSTHKHQWVKALPWELNINHPKWILPSWQWPG